ncbi:hypothetical protein F0562_020441 [Nyssa sinensis]|uniref:Beta-galactosidase n=1 Tax=Nyssa sinensis TaxID=561372 RepID=A0A5J5BTG5_9ASTE|nr:hypothetical protein F0562_020441 [Nyssa sinensis]
MAISSRVLLLALLVLLVSSVVVHGQKKSNQKSITYDGRSLIINGSRQLFFSGSIHYPRSPPEFNFEGNYDLVKFIKLIGENNMYATLRVGPFIEAEWNLGGFPYWLKDVPNITFRADNEPFKYHMKKYVKMIIDMMKQENLFAPQGGPIIMSQIENEYNNVQLAYRELGTQYIQWAANMAVGLKTGVPWIMCKQKDAPDPVINTCNGRHCGDTFTGPNSPNKPSLWTENWTAQYRVFGDPPSQRAAEDIAYSVARFFSKNGTLTNYYMACHCLLKYYGGTNYGRTGSSFVTTRYYDEAPLDEYALPREPKWGHLRDLHRALRLSKRALLWGTPAVQRVNQDLEIVAQHNARNFHPSKTASNLKWEMYQESIPTINDLPIKNKIPLELYSFTKDASDYAWYSTSINFNPRDLPMRADILPVLQIANLGHAMLAFVNGEYIGSGHGSNIEKSFVFQKPIKLKTGINHITLLGMTVGLPDSGAYMEHRFAGVRAVSIQGLNAGTLDVTQNQWGHETYFDAPEGKNPVALRMTSMGKGMVWVNGKSIGRYWVTYLSPLGKPSQSEYHVPRAFLKPQKNLLVVFEETGGKPEGIKVLLVNRDTICSFVTEYHPAHVRSWERAGDMLRTVVDEVKSGAHLICPGDKVIKVVEFASYGDPYGICGTYSHGKCTSPNTQKVVEQHCLGKNSCSVPIDGGAFGDNGCPNNSNTLAVQVRCAHA